MAQTSKIEWTNATWNPVTGCTKVSAGCANCYAERMAKRLHAMGHDKYANVFAPTVHPDTVDDPTHWTKPRMIFVCSMSDLMHEDVPDEFIIRVIGTMSLCRQHTFQVLTKRSWRLANFAWPDNVWVGVTVEHPDFDDRIDQLRAVMHARVRFISVEPMLGPFETLDVRKIDWVIVGGETGPGARPMKPTWVRDIRDRCVRQNIPFFFKQWGGPGKRSGRTLDGRTWDEMPRV